MKLKECVLKFYPDFKPIQKIHRKDNIKPYNHVDLTIFFSAPTLELVIVPKNQINENNEIILPSNADLLVKYNYHIIQDIDINIESFLHSEFIEKNNIEESLSKFFYKFFS